jgi:hypothetical protein
MIVRNRTIRQIPLTMGVEDRSIPDQTLVDIFQNFIKHTGMKADLHVRI